MKYVLSILILVLLLGGFFFYKEINSSIDPRSGEIVIFEVEAGEGVKNISINLKNEGIIKYSSFFRIDTL